LANLKQKYRDRTEISFIGYVAEDDIPELLQRSSVAVLPYTSSAGSSGIAHLACTYGVPIVASDIPDFRRLADEEGLAIDFFPTGNIPALADHLADLLGDKDRQVEMALQNVSAALRMSMPAIIREYLRTFELRQGIEDLRAISMLRKLPRWFPLRETLVRRRTSKIFRRKIDPSPALSTTHVQDGAEVVYFANAASAEAPAARTGTDGV
jgi:glycosyltransferase involved in cell wall biosynthesis